MPYLKSFVRQINTYYFCALFSLMTEVKGNVFDAIESLVKRSFLIFTLVNILFWVTEKIVFKEAFVHVGDYILLALLIVNFAWSMVAIFQIKKKMNQYIFLLA